MTPSRAGIAGRFKKGDDPRRNKTGCRSREATSFAERFANALAEGGSPKEISDILWEKARKGQPWALEIVLDRLIGKPKENEGQPTVFKIVYGDEP